MKPPSGISVPRSALFTAVSEITTPDQHTVQFKLSEPRSVNYIMSAIATGWNVILRKKTLDDSGGNLRRVLGYPGTGPYTSVRRVENAFEGHRTLPLVAIARDLLPSERAAHLLAREANGFICAWVRLADIRSDRGKARIAVPQQAP